MPKTQKMIPVHLPKDTHEMIEDLKSAYMKENNLTAIVKRDVIAFALREALTNRSMVAKAK